MLKHEDNSDMLSPPAAQVRVTPEELATAVSRIEARKDTDQRRADGTIPIGEAVQQLGLAVTPEEVLAEVQAIRQEPMRTKKRRPLPARRLVLALGLGGVLLGLGLGENSLSQMRSHQAAKSAGVSTAAPVPSNAPKPISLDPNLLVSTASDKLVRLSEVGDNQPVGCNYSGGSFLPSSGGLTFWTLIKHDGRVFVRGWIPRMSDQVFQKDGADVNHWESQFADTDPSNTRHVQLTLPLNGFQVLAGRNDGIDFHAVNIHLDQHAYEKWNP